jgi:hypothetical protein
MSEATTKNKAIIITIASVIVSFWLAALILISLFITLFFLFFFFI